jgi:hypothetical protein
MAPIDPDPSKSVGFLTSNQMKITRESVDEIGYNTCMYKDLCGSRTGGWSLPSVMSD